MTKKLSDFRLPGDVETPVPKVRAKPVQSLKPATEWHPNVLAFDQSLASTGWAWLLEGVPVRTGMLPTTPLMDPGFEDSFQRGLVLSDGVREVIRSLAMVVSTSMLIAHEMPIKPNPRMKVRNHEGSIVAAMAVRFAASLSGHEVVMLHPHDIRKMLCGTTTATTKDSVREAVRRLVTVDPALKYLNEHTYDAMGIGIVAAERRGR